MENQFTRREILGFIKGKPGAYHTEIKEALGLKNGSFEYHLGVLLKAGKIKKRPHGRKIRFFPEPFTIGSLSQYEEMNEREKKCLLYLRDNTIGTVKDIGWYFKSSKQNVYPVIKNLREKGLIFYKEDEKISKGSITLTEKGWDEIEKIVGDGEEGNQKT